jgi:hypothetical protein
VLQLGGDITAADTAELRRHLAELLVHDTGDMVICDLSRIRSADPEALTVLATPHGQPDAPGPSVCLAGARGSTVPGIWRSRTNSTPFSMLSLGEGA